MNILSRRVFWIRRSISESLSMNNNFRYHEHFHRVGSSHPGICWFWRHAPQRSHAWIINWQSAKLKNLWTNRTWGKRSKPPSGKILLCPFSVGLSFSFHHGRGISDFQAEGFTTTPFKPLFLFTLSTVTPLALFSLPLSLSHTYSLSFFYVLTYQSLSLSLLISVLPSFSLSFPSLSLSLSLSLIISVSPLSLLSVCHLSVSLFVLHFSHFFFFLPLSLFSAASRSLFPVFLRGWRQTQKVDVDWKPFLLRSLICFETDPLLSLFSDFCSFQFFFASEKVISLSLSLSLSHQSSTEI